MLAILYLIILVLLAIIAGPLLAYPIYLTLHTMLGMEFHKLVGNTTLLSGLLISFIYLKFNNISFIQGFGYALPRKLFLKQMLVGYGFGILIILCIVMLLFVVGVYGKENDLDLSAGHLIKIIIVAIVAGCLVGLIEESIFRGALFSGLYKNSNALTAIIATSLVYAAVHFLKFRKIADETAINWTTGLEMIPDALFRFRDPVIIDSFLTLFMLGVLLSLIRLRHNNIALVAGIHAGIVMSMKLTGEFTDYVMNNAYPYLVNEYDHLLGNLAMVWLAVLCTVYVVWNKNCHSE